MRLLLLLLLALFFSNCVREEVIDTPVIHFFDNEYLMIDSIFNKERTHNNIERFEYDSNGRLVIVESYQNKKFNYDREDKLVSIRNYDKENNSFSRMDSIVYDSNDRIHKVLNFNYRPKYGLVYEGVKEFEYNDIDTVLIVYTILGSDKINGGSYRYYWENGNVIKREKYDSNGDLAQEHIYRYDDEISYKKNHPFFLLNPLNWSNNNVTEIRGQNHRTIRDFVCAECIYEYNYDVIGLPLLITRTDTGGDRYKRISYK